MLTEIFLLLIAFQVKHLVADYYLQVPYMYENKGKAVGWFVPLASHAIVHYMGTALIVVGYFLAGYTLSPIVAVLPLVDFITHIGIDRWKATQPEGPDTEVFWNHLGIDQMLHHLVGIVIIYALVV